MGKFDITWKDMPEGRFLRIMTPTPWQRKHPDQSGFEAMLKQKIDSWTRGMLFTWIWEDAGQEWSFVQDEWGPNNTRWIRYVPFFWRNGVEFFAWEAEFIEKATQKHPYMTQEEFRRQGEKIKRDVNLGAIQSALLGAASKAPAVVRHAAQAMDKVNDVNSYVDMAKCYFYPDEYEKECAAVVAGWAMKGLKKHISR